MDESGVRRHRRYPVKWGVELSAGSWQEVLQLSTSNVSRGGLYVRSDQHVEQGARVRITLKLPDNSRMEVEGEIVHTVGTEQASSEMPPGFGVRFDEKHAIDLELLEATAASHAGGRNVYKLDQKHLVLPALVRGLETGQIESTRAYPLGNGGNLRIPHPPPPIARPETQSLSDGFGSIPDVSLRVGARPGARPSAPPPPRAPVVAAPPSEEEEISIDSSAFAEVQPGPPAPTPAPPAAAPSTPAPSSPAPSARAKGSDPIFGIDFGTTYSSIALVSGEGIRVLEDEEGNAMTPSVICYPGPGAAPIVGWQAREMLPVNRANTFLSPKRLLGRDYDDPHAQPFLASSPISTQRGPNGQILATVHGQVLAFPQVCAEVFRRLITIGERASGEAVRRVVLSTPVGYTPNERAAIERSAKLAGLEVVASLEEPVAASMAYGLGRGEGEIIAIYDFGGGTFDCTVLEIKNQRFNKLGAGGDAWLGGDDFDLAMADHTANQFWREHDIDLRKRAVEWQRLVLLCERAKRKLSTEQRVELRARGIVQTARGPLDLAIRFDRQVFAELCGGLVQRSVDEMDACLRGAGLSPSDLHHVVLTGGVSRIPLVRQHLQNYYQREIQLAVNPEQAIVMGNAIYARFLQLTGGKRSLFE